MAPLPPPAGFVAGTPTPSFSTIVFSDPAKDPDAGNYTALAPFLYDIHNNAANTPVADIRDLVNGRASNMDPLAMIMLVVDSVAKVYLCPKWLDQPLGTVAHTRWNATYAYDGDLLGGTAYNVIVNNAAYELIPNLINVPTVATTILVAVGGDPALIAMGPYQNGDACTEVV